jgi:hypothetical protein
MSEASVTAFRTLLAQHVRKLRRCAVLFLLAAGSAFVAAGPALAQALDEIKLVDDGNDAVIQLRFNVRVQYQRHAPLDASDVLEIYFQLLGGDEALTRPIEETLSMAGRDPAPGASVLYPVQSGLPVKKVVVHLTRKATFRVRAGANNQLLEIVLPGMAARAPAAPAAPVAEHDRFAIVLQSVPVEDRATLKAVPASMQDFSIFGSETTRDGHRYSELVLGYFDTQAAAAAVLARVTPDFPQARVIDVVARKEANLENAAQVVPPPAEAAAPSGAAAAAAAVAAVPDTELDKQGAELLAKAKSALIAGHNDEAINLLNRLLLLPPNKASQDAQELVGLARERSGDLAQARKEYELYLRLFPTGEGAVRVRQRLVSLVPPEPAPTVAAKPPEKHEPRLSAGGSVSQYYYGGKQQVQTVFLGTPLTANQQTISNTTQSSIVTTVDLNGRYRTDTTDTRIVVRDNDQYSLISSSVPSLNRMDSAFVDFRDTAHGIGLKVGRQSGVTGGLVGRFDGVVASYDAASKVRVNGVIGVPVAQDQFVDNKQRFEGLSVEAQNLLEHWGGSGFLINQTADGQIDRRAVGGDLRYFDTTKTLYALVDYDLAFGVLNAATLQGTYQFPDQTSMSLLLDDRKAPTLLTSNGLLKLGCTTFAQYFAGQCTGASAPFTVDVLRQDALATTATSHQYSFDVSRPLGEHWQVSGNVRMTSVGALPTVTLNGQTFQGTSATGNVLGLSVQATGSNLYSRRDINVFSLTHLHSSTLTGNQLAVNNLNTFLEGRLTVEPNLSLYHETDTNGQALTRWGPGLHCSYKLSRRMSLDSTLSLEHSQNTGPTQNDTTNNIFYFVGYHYDLNN